MAHKAKAKEVPAITWFSKGCPSDRLAVSIFDTALQAARRKRLCMYRGGMMDEGQTNSAGRVPGKD
eukprot:4152676-Prorocentrum_lima.AAC.1